MSTPTLKKTPRYSENRASTISHAAKESARQHKDDGHNREPRHQQFAVHHHIVSPCKPVKLSYETARVSDSSRANAKDFCNQFWLCNAMPPEWIGSWLLSCLFYSSS
jgi:hypothetical protein